MLSFFCKKHYRLFYSGLFSRGHKSQDMCNFFSMFKCLNGTPLSLSLSLSLSLVRSLALSVIKDSMRLYLQLELNFKQSNKSSQGEKKIK